MLPQYPCPFLTHTAHRVICLFNAQLDATLAVSFLSLGTIDIPTIRRPFAQSKELRETGEVPGYD